MPIFWRELEIKKKQHLVFIKLIPGLVLNKHLFGTEVTIQKLSKMIKFLCKTNGWFMNEGRIVLFMFL